MRSVMGKYYSFSVNSFVLMLSVPNKVGETEPIAHLGQQQHP